MNDNLKLTAQKANLIASVKGKRFSLENEIYADIYKSALLGKFSIYIDVIRPSEIDAITEKLIQDGYKVEVSEEYYYGPDEYNGFKDVPYVGLKISW